MIMMLMKLPWRCNGAPLEMSDHHGNAKSASSPPALV